MERLPGELCLNIFRLLDHQALATALQVCRKWKKLASDNALWCDLFKERWGGDSAAFYAPQDAKSWKDVYIVQDRCDRCGLGLKIIREGGDYYLIYQGEIQRFLGSSKHGNGHEEDEEQQGTGSRTASSSFLGIWRQLVRMQSAFECDGKDAEKCPTVLFHIIVSMGVDLVHYVH